MIVVTGATGLLGSNIIHKFANEGFDIIAFYNKTKPTFETDSNSKVRWVNCDILDIHSLAENIPPSATVVHTAALVSFHPHERDLLFKTNVEGTANVVNVCLTRYARLIHVSSVAALGRQKRKWEIDESAIWAQSPLNSTYGESKYFAELEVYRGIEEGLHATIVCPSFILAPAHWDKSSAQIFKYIWQERPFYSGGFANYVDVRDVVEVIYRLYLQQSHYLGERFIASAGSIPYGELFTSIAQRLGKKPPFIKINDNLVRFIAQLEEIRCFITQTAPLITRESVKSAGEKFIYSNKKSITRLEIKYHTIEETLQMCCEHYLRTYSTKK